MRTYQCRVAASSRGASLVARKDAACTMCGKAMWSGRDLAAAPTCRECRSTGIRRTQGSPCCQQCGIELERRKGRSYCSPECRAEGVASKLRTRDVVTVCGWCGKQCKRPSKAGQTAVCSLECRNAWTLYVRGLTTSPWHPGINSIWTIKQRRQARITATRNGVISRQYVFKRDRWTCHLCGTKVQQDQRAPSPLAPTLDHIVPLARGGTHTYDNLALAHFICNSTKSDRGGGEQMLLVG